MYPRLIVQKYFYDNCKEKKRDIIRIIDVSLGLLISDDVFELNDSDDYTIVDRQKNSVRRIPTKSKSDAK